MKNKHLKLVSCALMASLFSTSSCVDNDYDLMEDIDLTIQVGGSEFAIPGGETEPIKLSKILDIEEDGVVKIDENGNYFLLQEGTEQTTNISVAGFEMESPAINPIRQTLNFTVPSYNTIGTKANGIELPPVDLPTETTSFNLNSSDLPKEIKGLSFINVDMLAAIHFSFEPSIVENLYLKTIDLNFPKFIQSPALTDGVLHLEEKIASSSSGLAVLIQIDGIDCNNEGITFRDGNLSIQGEISLDGAVTIHTGEIHGQPGDVAVTLKADITLLDAQTKQTIINVQSITGKVKPDIDINIEPVTLTGLPDFLDDERVTLSVERPMIFFTANNNTPVSAQITKGEIRSFTNKNGIIEPVSDPEHPATFQFTIDKGANEKICLYPSGLKEPEIEGVTKNVAVENLTTLISRIPDIFEFEVVAEASDDDNTEVLLNHTYTITTDYDVNVPFVFGDQISQIVYKDSVDGWYDDLKDYEVQQINATATAINQIPLGLNFTAKALTVDANGNAEELKGVTVTVIVDDKQNGIIKAGKNSTATESALVIEIKETTPGAVKKLDGLAFEIVAATSGEEAKGQQLNENQTLQLKDVRLKVPGGAIVDLN